ncbi:MAG: GIY-YIG nuclease family protein [Vagococcus sp.]|jgi:hypothetical protein|nr:GIY-YIG nuclease family protein [Vagococcus sp.]
MYSELKDLNIDNQDMGYVYVLYNPDSNLVKIGKTKAPHQRFRQLSNQNGSLFKYYISEPMFIEGIVEKIMLNKFASKRVKGEWFSSISFNYVVDILEELINSKDFKRRNVKR